MERKNYSNLFRWDGKISCLHSELALKGSHGLVDPLIIFHKGSWHTFMRNDKSQFALEKGFEIFRSKERYLEYSEGFRAFIRELQDLEIPELNKENLRDLIEFLGKMFEFYGLTEFFCTDLAFQELEKTNDSVLKENLDDFGQLKIEGREALNHIAHEQGLFAQIFIQLSERFLSENDDAFFLFSDELLGLFDGEILDRELINNRKKCYVISKVENTLLTYSHNVACEFAKEFTKFDSGDCIKGSIANRGIARGKIVVAPMLTDSAKINEVIAKMKDGNILVAQSTTPEFMVLIKKASAIVTDQAGMLSHAAIVSRELNIPCIVGTGNATRVFKDGDIVEVDANNGVVRKIT
jgi:phosphoenolpyruvate synthase/pyruvate phosphate dikinase